MAGRALAVLGLLLLSGCSSESAGGGASGSAGAAGSAGGSGSAGTAGSAGADAGTPPCSEDPTRIPADSNCILEVRGRVVDGSGSPMPNLLTSVCGPVCFYGETGGDGSFSVTIGAHIPPTAYSTLPHGRPSLTSFYYQLPASAEGTVEVGDLLVLSLPASGPLLVTKQDASGAPAQTVTSGDVTLEVAEGVSVRIDVEDVVLGDDGRMFRALAIPAEHRDAFAPSALGLVALYAFTPFEAVFLDAASGDPASARLSFANTANLPAGSAVEVLALGSYLYPEWVTPAAFEPVASASVSGDGTRIDLDAGGGLPYLTWVGLRAKP